MGDQLPSGSLGELNEPQARAVGHVDGPLIVFAGAGSGKTRVITYRIANLVAVHGVPPYRVLAVTFTNKAAGEMRARLLQLLGEHIAHDLWIGTFHAVCVRLIRQYHQHTGLSANFVIYDDSDQKALMARVLAELDIDPRRYAPQKLLARIGREKQEARGPDDMSVDNYFDEIAQRCFVVYQRRLTDANAADFSDLLLHVLRLAESPDQAAGRELCAQFSHVLVDEFQDVNLVQYRLVRALAGEQRNICVVGDDDQSIYRWRGADVRNIRGFTRDYADAELIKLEQNYRSSGHIVSAALGVIQRAYERQPKELWTANPAGPLVKVLQATDERDESANVVAGVRQAIEEGTPPDQVAIFYRVHAQSRVLEEAMRTEGVPYQIVGGHKFFERAEIKDLLGYLRIIVNPRSDVDLLRIINKPPRRIGNKTVSHLTALAERRHLPLLSAIEPLRASGMVGKAAKQALGTFARMIASFVGAAATASPRELAEQVLEECGYARWLRGQDNAEADARLDNLRELLGSVGEYEEERRYADEPATLADYLTRVSLIADADTLEGVPRVPMMTVHAAKGLEFDRVFITGAEERLFPLRGQRPGEEDELEEERRLAYVAITRARHQLCITHTSTRTIYGEMRYNAPSRFLRNLPAADCEHLSTAAAAELVRPFSAAHHPPERYLDRQSTAQPEDSEAQDGFDEVPFDFDLEPDELRAGSRVRHGKFGAGVVQGIDPGRDPTVTVKFPGRGSKRIKLRFLSPA